MSFTQSIEAPLTVRDTATMSGERHNPPTPTPTLEHVIFSKKMKIFEQ